jgi:hypothetical protein
MNWINPNTASARHRRESDPAYRRSSELFLAISVLTVSVLTPLRARGPVGDGEDAAAQAPRLLEL